MDEAHTRTGPTGPKPRAAACGRSEEVEELARSALRQAEIKRRIAEAEQKLKDRELARKGKRGRMKVHEQTIEKTRTISTRCSSGCEEGTSRATRHEHSERTARAVLASAQQNLQHDAAGGAAPAGRLRPRRAAVPTMPMTTEAAPAMRTTARIRQGGRGVPKLFKPNSAPAVSSLPRELVSRRCA